MKPRLIDANEYLQKVCTYKETGCGSCKFQECCPKDQPTVYDIDKVVEQLEEIQNLAIRTGQGYCPNSDTGCRFMFSELGCEYCAFEKAIEIVKGGQNA